MISIKQRWSMLILIAVLSLSALSACDTTFGNATVVPVFPTAIPPGTALPTFGGGGAPPVATSAFLPTPPPAGPTSPPVTAPQPTPVAKLDEAGWSALSGGTAGAQWRRLSYRNQQGVNVGVLVARFDPARVTFRAHYTPGQARTIQQWQQAHPSALAIVNANFYTPQNNALGLVVADGVVYGRASLRTQQDDGMFQVKNGAPKVRSMWLEPFQPTERFEQAVHAYPILMAFGQAAPINPDLAQVNAARTVIAQDKQGRILLMVTQFSNTTLGDLAQWLSTSGLELDTAVNMDGGTSTAMYLATGGPSQFTTGLKPVPVVLAVYPR